MPYAERTSSRLVLRRITWQEFSALRAFRSHREALAGLERPDLTDYQYEYAADQSGLPSDLIRRVVALWMHEIH